MTTRHRHNTFIFRTSALIIGTALVLTGCATKTDLAASTTQTSPPNRGDLTLTLGALLPSTGSLAAGGAAAQAGVDLAIQDINDAKVGITVESTSADAADADGDTATTSATTLIDSGVDAIIGPISDPVSKTVIEQIASEGVLEVSPGTTSLDFSRFDDDDLYWRTSASCAREGAALGEQIADSGVTSLAIIYEKAFCEPGLPQAVSDGFARSGGEVVAETSFDSGADDLSKQVDEIVAAKPGAVAILSPTGAKLAVPDLSKAGLTGDQLFFVGMGIKDQSDVFAAGSLTGAIATRRGVDLSKLSSFTDRVKKIDPKIADFTYGPESYDAVILLALAALAAGSTDSADMAGRLQEVSGGAGGGTKETTFDGAAEAILAGETVDYDGPSGAITFDENGDAADAAVGIFQYGKDNKFARLN